MLDLPIWGPSPQEAEIARLKADRDHWRGMVVEIQSDCALVESRATAAEAESARMVARIAGLTRDVETYKDAQAVSAGELHDVADALGVHAEDAVERARVLCAILTEAREALKPLAEMIERSGYSEEFVAADDDLWLEEPGGLKMGEVRRARSLLARLTPQAPTPESEG